MNTSSIRYFISALLVVTAFYRTAQAASPNVDAGSLLQQNERELKSAKPSLKSAPRKVAPTAPADPTQATVQVKAFAFQGNTLLSSDALQSALVTFTNRALTLEQLKEAAVAVTNTYREAGWTARAYVPKQEINGGIVTIQIVEAVFGGASVQEPLPQRVQASRLVRMTEGVLTKGQPIHANDIDRALLLLDDLPGISVSGSLTEGQNDGETNLVIYAKDDSLITGNASLDNQGSRATGTDRLSVNLSLNSPMGLGDALTINALKTQGTDYQRFGYTVGIGYTAWRAGVHASNLTYRVITPEFNKPNVKAYGSATTLGWDATYPLVRSQLQNVNLALSYDDKTFDNTFLTNSTAYAIKVYNATLSAAQTDQWQGGGITSTSVSVATGDKNTEGRYSKLGLNLSRLQTLNSTLSAYVGFNAQVANRNLDSSEKLYLGGASGVRAYPASEAGGSDGNMLALELRQRVAHNLSLIGFYDYGWVKANHDNNVTSPASPNGYVLQGYGITLAWQVTPSTDIKATVAQRMGNNPAANTTTGLDSDGTKKITRIWLSAGMAF